MSLVELPQSFVADWKAHYAGARARLDRRPVRYVQLPKPDNVPMPEPEKKEPEPIELPPWPFVPKGTAPRLRPTVREIQMFVGRRCRISLTEILAARRNAAVVVPRQMAMYLAKKLTLHSLPEIGRYFGGRDHTTVLHACRKIEEKRVSNLALQADLDAIEKDLFEFIRWFNELASVEADLRQEGAEG